MACRSNSARTPMELSRIGFGTGDELWKSLGRERWVHDDHVRHAHDASDWRGVADEIEVEAIIERCVDRVCLAGHQECVTARRRPDDSLGCNVGPGPGPVLDNELLD